jgi:protein ImuB
MRWIALQALVTEPALMDAAALQRAISAMALGFTPRVALLDEAVVMEVSGSLRLFGGLRKLLALLEQQLQQFLASNMPLAQYIRAQGATSLIALGRLRLLRSQHPQPACRVADMPMQTLSAARPHLDVLERMGCRSWDDLLKLPRDGVARRFGAPLLAALDRARGVLPDSYTWLQLPERFDEKLELDALVEHAPALMAGVSQLLAQLQAWLLGRQSGLTALKIIWHFDKRRGGAATGELVVRSANNAQDLRHVARLITERLNQQTLAAPVHSIGLQSLVTEKLCDAALATTSLLPEDKQHGDSALQLFERLSARLGAAHVQTWQARADHRPEQMQKWQSVVSTTSNTVAIKSGAACTRIHWSKGLKDPENRLENGVLYPSWLLAVPLKLAAVSGSPVYQGPLHKLAGPQRLEATGWLLADQADIAPALRDYFIYRSRQGVLLWIYSERLALASKEQTQREWYLQGVFA